MKKTNPKLVLSIGIILLVISGLVFWKAQSSGISSTDQVECEEYIQKKYNNQADPQLLGMCKTSAGFVAQNKAEAQGVNSAEELAKAISSANQKDTGGAALYMFLVGFFLIVGFILIFRGIKGLAK